MSAKLCPTATVIEKPAKDVPLSSAPPVVKSIPLVPLTETDEKSYAAVASPSSIAILPAPETVLAETCVTETVAVAPDATINSLISLSNVSALMSVVEFTCTFANAEPSARATVFEPLACVADNFAVAPAPTEKAVIVERLALSL